MSSAREVMLRVIREANRSRTGGSPETADETQQGTSEGTDRTGPNIPRAYRRSGTRGSVELLDLLEERMVDYRANVSRCGPSQLPQILEERIKERGVRALVIPRDIPDTWIRGIPGWEVEVRRDHDPEPLSVRQMSSADGALTGCAIAVAETGTLVLDGGRHQGRRTLTLLPDYHLCVVFQRQVVETVPETMGALEDAIKLKRAPLTLISGPSATSDIELIRVEGVHGPRNLDVILVEDG
jgi:L-lactate dehydrogenase complex protein LldG